jgi:hypothetical protein
MLYRMITLAAAMTLSSTATQAEVLFRGTYVVTSANAACTDGPNVGDQDNAQFHPRGLGNDNFAALTRIFSFGGNSYSLDAADFSTAYKKVNTGGLGWSKYDSEAQAFILLNPVPKITTTTETLTLVGKIKNPTGQNNQANCEASFRALMYKHID